jgi:hypothetical protein
VCKNFEQYTHCKYIKYNRQTSHNKCCSGKAISLIDKLCGENLNIYLGSITILEYRAIYVIMYKHVVERGGLRLQYGAWPLHAG